MNIEFTKLFNINTTNYYLKNKANKVFNDLIKCYYMINIDICL